MFGSIKMSNNNNNEMSVNELNDGTDDQQLEIRFHEMSGTRPSTHTEVDCSIGVGTLLMDQLYGKEGNFYVYFKNNTLEPIDIQFYKSGLLYISRLKKSETINAANGGLFEFSSRNGFLGKTEIKCKVMTRDKKSVKFHAFGNDSPREKNEFEVNQIGVYMKSGPERHYDWVEDKQICDNNLDQ